MSKLPKTFEYCSRCNKDVTESSIHTCTPSAKYRAAMLEGIRLVFDTIDSSYDTNRMALFNSYGYHEEVLGMIEKLIEQYSSKENK